MNDDRYQYQPRHVQIARWLRWRPLYVCQSIRGILQWAWQGMPVTEMHPTRLSVVAFIWTTGCSLAQHKMKHYWTSEEILDEIADRIQNDEIVE